MGNSADPATGYGGGLAVWVSSSTPIINCTFYDCSGNTGGGVLFGKYCSATMVNCTLANNQATNGGGIGFYYAESLTLVNTIIAFSTQGEAVHGNGTVSASHCDVYGNAGGDWIGPIAGQLGINSNISEDPLFADKVENDFHLCFSSPCKDSGDNQAPGLTGEDFEGDPRIAFDTVDMGADEFYTHLYVTGDTTPGGSIEGKFVGVPGTLQVGLWFGSGVLDPPLPSMFGLWFLQYPWLGPIVLWPIPAEGVLVVPADLPSTPPAPYDLPMQALIGDTLTNLWVLEVR